MSLNILYVIFRAWNNGDLAFIFARLLQLCSCTFIAPYSRAMIVLFFILRKCKIKNSVSIQHLICLESLFILIFAAHYTYSEQGFNNDDACHFYIRLWNW